MDPKDIEKEVESALKDLRSSRYLATENRVGTTKDYFVLAFAKRTRKCWWGDYYLLPDSLAMNEGELTGDLPLCSEWDEFHRRIKKDFPIQAFFRITIADWFDTIQRRTGDRYRDVRNWLFPRQRWLMEGIPNHWMDKKTLSVDLLYKLVVHFVEVEDALNVINWDSDPETRTFKQGLIECYKWIKAGRPELMAQMETEMAGAAGRRQHLYKTNGHGMETYKAIYGSYDELEAHLEDMDTEMCVWIINNRQYLWT